VNDGSEFGSVVYEEAGRLRVTSVAFGCRLNNDNAGLAAAPAKIHSALEHKFRLSSSNNSAQNKLHQQFRSLPNRRQFLVSPFRIPNERSLPLLFFDTLLIASDTGKSGGERENSVVGAVEWRDIATL